MQTNKYYLKVSLLTESTALAVVCCFIFERRQKVNNFTVIKVIKEKKGQTCQVERTFDNLDEAEVYCSTKKIKYGTNWLTWVVDKY